MSIHSYRDRLAQRSLDKIYRHFGRPCLLTLPNGQKLSGQLAKLDIIEQEQAVDGSRIEVDMKGFTVRFRRHSLPDDVLQSYNGSLPTGTHITFDPPVLGYTHFHIDTKSMAFNRDGGQIIAQITPTTAKFTAQSLAPTGLPLG